jgi:purine-binding chemotaxis protein CheW
VTALATLVAAAGGQRTTPVVAAVPTVAHVGLRTGTRWFAVPAAAVIEVVPRPELTRLPAAPAQLVGVAMVRARLTAFVDLDVLSAGRLTPRLERGRAVVIRAGGIELGLIAAETRGLLGFTLAGDGGEAAPAERPAWIAREERCAGELYAVIDPARLIEVALPGAG